MVNTSPRDAIYLTTNDVQDDARRVPERIDMVISRWGETHPTPNQPNKTPGDPKTCSVTVSTRAIYFEKYFILHNIKFHS